MCLKKRKKTKFCEGDLDHMPPSQRQATVRGLLLASELGFKNGKLQNILINKIFQKHTLHHYNINNETKAITGEKVHFSDNVVISNNLNTIIPSQCLSDFELILMSVYYSVSLIELRHHIGVK